MLYLDTSVLVAALTNEDLTSRTQEWLQGVSHMQLCVSDWTRVEFSSALSQKCRMRLLDEAGKAAALSRFDRLCDENFEIASVAAADFSTAAGLCERPESGLRAGDALHLAVCIARQWTICSNDAGFLKACKSLGAASVGVALP